MEVQPLDADQQAANPMSIGELRGQEAVQTTATMANSVAWPVDRAGPGLGVFPERTAAGPFNWAAWATKFIELTRVPLRFILVGLTAYIFAFNFSVVRGSSMAPGIHDGDRILIDQFSYIFSEVERGDVVVLQYPLNPKLDYIKRVVGLPGDEVVMEKGRTWINGALTNEFYLKESDPFTDMAIVVQPGHFFVLGDNRLHSSDSREFGQVAANLVRGKVDIRLWPPSRAGRVR
ncbi:MAG: signal peptidase I [Planctomycetota bacterium]|jgi:signal peptidase I